MKYRADAVGMGTMAHAARKLRAVAWLVVVAVCVAFATAGPGGWTMRAAQAKTVTSPAQLSPQLSQPAATQARSGATGVASDAGNNVTQAQLPREAVATLRLIVQGGPYPYAKDGSVFGNFERLLPVQPRGYYHEYTVAPPARQRARNRGARRIVCGGPLRQTGDCFYTGDHYTSFRRIVE